MLPASVLLDLLRATGLCMVCYGNVSSMRHIYGKSFDNTRQHIFTCVALAKAGLVVGPLRPSVRPSVRPFVR